MPQHAAVFQPYKRQRRTATAVLAGDFDLRPARDALTSLLNGVEAYKVVEKDDEAKREKRRERKEKEREKKRAKLAAVRKINESGPNTSVSLMAASASKSSTPVTHHSTISASSFWRARPTIHIATMQRSRSVSVTPPPLPSSPASTPGPSISSSTSRTSSKRPRTPEDHEDLIQLKRSSSPPPPRKKRVAVKKGWKGWVEGSPPPSEKLINLDAVPVLQERRTRSGKSFDAISTGKDDWV